MKKICLAAVVILCGTALFAEQNSTPVYSWSLLWSGSWEESASKPLNGILNNRGETTLHYIPYDIMWRGQVLGRRPLNLNFDSFQWNEDITRYNLGMYHKSTGSRLLIGALEEAGLPARIRSPWLRSPPYTENHKNSIADLRTSISNTREDEVYLYLSSPLLILHQNLLLSGFFSAQTELEKSTPAFSGGLDFRFPKNTRLLAEMFYTERTMPPVYSNSWFVNKTSSVPPLPERDFRLIAAGLLFKNQLISVSSDFAQSKAFAWGEDIYANLGLSLSLRPVLVSIAADGSGKRFINRYGVDYGEGFRTAAKVEWRYKYNSLLKIDTVLRGQFIGEDFNRSSTGIYYRFPASRDSGIVRVSAISLSADRNAVNPQKIRDSFSGALGLNINLEKAGHNGSLRLNFSGTAKGLCETEEAPNPYPIPDKTYKHESTAVSCEPILTSGKYQLRSKLGCTVFVEKDKKWDYSISGSVRFKQGRFTLKTTSTDFPKKWNWSASWRMEIHGKS